MKEAMMGSRELLESCRDMLRELNAVREPEKKKKAQWLLSCYEKPMRSAMKELRIGTSLFFWRLSSREKQQKAMSAFNYLFDVCSIGLGPEIRNLKK